VRGFFVRYLLALTRLWVVILRAIDLIPKEAEMIPRGGEWRPATEADRLQSFVWFTGCWYVGALVAVGLVWRVAQVISGGLFGLTGRVNGSAREGVGW
jgi:hypothetical protein